MKHYDKTKDTKTIISFLVVLLAFSLLVMFTQYKDEIFQSGNFNMFMVLAFVAMGLFLGLLYLVSNEVTGVKVVKSGKSVKATKSKKKK